MIPHSVHAVRAVPVMKRMIQTGLKRSPSVLWLWLKPPMEVKPINHERVERIFIIFFHLHVEMSTTEQGWAMLSCM